MRWDKPAGWAWGIGRLLGAVALGVLVGAVVAVIGSLLVALFAVLADLDLDLGPAFRVFNYLSLGYGSVYAARRVQRMGWLTGLLVGVIYFAALTWWLEGDLSPLLTGSDRLLLTQLGLAGLVGMIGGVVGVNLVP